METVLQAIKDVGAILVPLILSAEGVYFVVKAILNHFSKKKNNKKYNLLTELLTNIAEKDSVKTEVKHQTEDIEKLISDVEMLHKTLKADDQAARNQMITISQMLSVIFEQSTLPNETKERLRALKTKIEYGADVNIVEQLLDENAKLKEDRAQLKSSLEEATKKQKTLIQDIAENVSKPIKKKSNIVVQ